MYLCVYSESLENCVNPEKSFSCFYIVRHEVLLDAIFLYD